MEDSIIFILGLVLGVLCFAYLVYLTIKFIKTRTLGGETPKIDSKLRFQFLICVGAQGLFTIMSSYGMAYWWKWNMVLGDHFMLSIGSYLFGTSFALLFSSFALYYYRPDLDEKQRKVARICMFSAIPVVVLGLYLCTQGFANYINYPLPNSISFKKLWGYPDGGGYGFTIAFYGIFIVTGAIISFFVSDHYFYKKYGKHGILDSLLLVAFPMGLVGARLWYCLVLEPSTYLPNPLSIFDVRQGGLAIQGGAILGIVSGVLFMLRFRKYVNIRFAMDVIVPTILIAQAMGRLGNFFNLEVHGGMVSMETWSFLPRIILNNLQYSSTSGTADLGMIYLPLFLIEGLMNISGYFVIRYGVGKGLKKWIGLGDLAMSYVIWYGLTRVALEPLRVGFTLNLGSSEAFGYLQSWITAFSMVAAGILGIVGFHVYDHIRKVKGLPPRTLETI